MGGLPVTPEANFARMRVERGPPDRRLVARLYDSTLPVFATVPSIPWRDHRKWTPEICLATICARTRQPFLSLNFYYPEQELLIVISLEGRSLTSDMFG